MIHWRIPHFQTSVCKLNIIGPYMTQCLAAGIFWNVHRSWAESSSVVLKPGSVSTSLPPPCFPVSTFFLPTCQPVRFGISICLRNLGVPVDANQHLPWKDRSVIYVNHPRQRHLRQQIGASLSKLSNFSGAEVLAGEKIVWRRSAVAKK